MHISRSVPAVTVALTCLLLLSASVSAQNRVEFEEVSEASGVAAFGHFSWRFGGDGLAGVAWFDYNDDGLLDLFFTNGKNLLGPGEGFPNALFENQGDGTFVDVAEAKGVTGGRGNAGVVAGDLDNDGDQDLFLTGDGGLLGDDEVTGAQTVDSGVLLLRNDGPPDYAFTEIDNAAAGLVGLESTMSPVLGDVNHDGLLDIFIASPGTRPLGCNPPPVCDPGDPTVLPHSSRLFLNRSTGGDLVFEDVSDASTVGVSKAGSMAAVLSDQDWDGQLELFIANGTRMPDSNSDFDMMRHDGVDPKTGIPTFTLVTAEVGLGGWGGWMGVAPGDFDNDLRTEFFVTNLGAGFPHALHRQQGATYENIADGAGLDGPSPSPADVFGWGATAQDFDNDGLLDLFFTGSFASDGSTGTPRGNPGKLLLNDPVAAIHFTDYSAFLDVDLSGRYSSGTAAADFDNDGRVDIAVATDNYLADQGRPVLLANRTTGDNRFLTVRLTGNGTTVNRDAIGARVIVWTGVGPERVFQMREVYGGSSFLSMDSKWLTFGLGAIPENQPVRVAVDWPDGPQTPFSPQNFSFHGPFLPGQIVDIVQP
jgi:hypothetical protein